MLRLFRIYCALLFTPLVGLFFFPIHHETSLILLQFAKIKVNYIQYLVFSDDIIFFHLSILHDVFCGSHENWNQLAFNIITVFSPQIIKFFFIVHQKSMWSLVGEININLPISKLNDNKDNNQ